MIPTTPRRTGLDRGRLAPEGQRLGGSGHARAEREERARHPGAVGLPDREAAPDQGTNGVRVNGFQQVVDLLRTADPAFRESLLRRLAARDSRLARSLREQL